MRLLLKPFFSTPWKPSPKKHLEVTNVRFLMLGLCVHGIVMRYETLPTAHSFCMQWCKTSQNSRALRCAGDICALGRFTIWTWCSGTASQFRAFSDRFNDSLWFEVNLHWRASNSIHGNITDLILLHWLAEQVAWGQRGTPSLLAKANSWLCLRMITPFSTTGAGGFDSSALQTI